MARLMLMRHAKSDWYSGEREDFLRPLNERGVRDARRMGAWLARAGYLPRAILSSPSRRTRDTLKYLAEGAGARFGALTRFEPTLYLATVSEMRAVLAGGDVTDGVMLLGHNPGMEELLDWLVPAQELAGVEGKRFPTAAFYALETATPLAQLERGCARVVAHQRPRLLED
ncbi:MAG: histidine phosphatase family protein [Gammaproteobacteria bacterium]|nr:histidine phosphatase family protein [Gammaproteobacteria bacterium]MCP5199219.1 histidine phosphatase family protein [Gammaproteobacteria bacterium]